MMIRLINPKKRKYIRKPKVDINALYTDDYQQIAKALNNMHKNRNGKPFSWKSIKSMMERWKNEF